jgi:hypothetical protein
VLRQHRLRQRRFHGGRREHHAVTSDSNAAVYDIGDVEDIVAALAMARDRFLAEVDPPLVRTLSTLSSLQLQPGCSDEYSAAVRFPEVLDGIAAKCEAMDRAVGLVALLASTDTVLTNTTSK